MRLTDQSKSLHSARTFLKEIILRKDPSKCKRAFVESKMPTAAIDRHSGRPAGLAWPQPQTQTQEGRCKRATISRHLLRSSPSSVVTAPYICARALDSRVLVPPPIHTAHQRLPLAPTTQLGLRDFAFHRQIRRKAPTKQAPAPSPARPRRPRQQVRRAS